MRIRPVARLAAVAALTLLLSPAGFAQSEPPAIDSLAATTSPLSDADKARIEAWGRYHLGRLTATDASLEQIDDAQEKLLRPLRSRGTNEIFLTAYSAAILPGLVALADADRSPYLSSNALITIGRLRTERALDALLDRCSARGTPAMHMRLAASRGIKDIVRSDAMTRMGVRKAQQVARRLRDAASAETEPLVLHHQLNGLASLGDKGFEGAIRKEIYQHLADALTDVAKRAGTTPVLLDATSQTVYQLLQLFASFVRGGDAILNRDIGQILMPAVVALADAYAGGAWSAAPLGSPERQRVARQVNRIQLCLTAMRGIAAPSGSVTVDLEAAWNAADLPKFRQGIAEWQNVLK